ncbi:protein-L-isoaspartate(D-aspartate) O-methyltransferase [bacterium]|nr:protein-L-isoaspartate(D-aspartate) O-methyltransferase [bacterium]
MKYFIGFTKSLFPEKTIRIVTIMISEEKYKAKRIKMVEEQIVGRGIKSSRVINVMKKIPRHLFVTEKYFNSAYNDNPLPIGFDQTISQPYIVAFMTEAIELRREDRVLEIGTGSGYQSAVLCELAGSIFSMETIPQLAERSSHLLSEIGYKNIRIKTGDGYKGWPEKAPFNKIIVTAAPHEIPEVLIEQLAENGIMILPVGNISQSLRIVKKKAGKIDIKRLISVRFVPMVQKYK